MGARAVQGLLDLRLDARELDPRGIGIGAVQRSKIELQRGHSRLGLVHPELGVAPMGARIVANGVDLVGGGGALRLQRFASEPGFECAGFEEERRDEARGGGVVREIGELAPEARVAVIGEQERGGEACKQQDGHKRDSPRCRSRHIEHERRGPDAEKGDGGQRGAVAGEGREAPSWPAHGRTK